MEQIKNYLSQLSRMNTILILSSSEEFQELEEWIKKNNKAENIFNNIEDCFESDCLDMCIFDYECFHQLSAENKLSCRYLIGRMRKEEDTFLLWEKYRICTETVFIEKEKGLRLKEITPDRPGVEILHWEKGKSGIELSVIIPVYNVAEYLPSCIETLIKWKAPYVEYLFIDDGSIDESANIIEGYAKTDQRIRLIKKTNGGCASARNLGIKESKGRYLGFVDSDDFIDENMFEKLFSRAIMGGYDIAYCGYQEYREETGESNPVRNDCLSFPYTEGTWRQDKVQLLAIKTRVAIWRCIYKKELLLREGILFHEELKRFDDLPFRVEVLFTAKSAVCVPEYLYYYRLGREGQDVSCQDDKLFVHFTIFELLDEFTDKFNEKRLVDLLQIVKIHTHGYGLEKIEEKYRKEYIHQAVNQLDRNMGFLRTLCLIFMYTGKKHIGWYTRMKIK